MEVAKTLLRNRAVLRCHCERLLRGIRQTTSSSICSNSELEKFVLSHRTVPNEAGDHRAASELPLGRGRFA